MTSTAVFDNGMKEQMLDEIRAVLQQEYELILHPFGLEEYASDLARGKFFRSHLLLVAAGKLSERTLRRCVALELLHTSTLVHDDIIDKATLRRDKPTLWNALGAEQALLIGNLITTRALTIAAKDSTDLCREFLKAYEGVNQAQQHEILQYGHLRNEEKCRDIIIGKTSVMLELALYAGVSLSDEWPCELTSLENVIRELGIVFQVKDDIEDVEAWLRQDRADRSKMAQFDIDLQNYTLPVTIAVKAMKLPENEVLEPSQISRISPKIWKESLRAANDYADMCVAYIHEQLKAAGREMDKDLAARVGEWSENFLEHAQKQSLDEAVKSNVQSKIV